MIPKSAIEKAFESGNWNPRGRTDVFLTGAVMGGYSFNLMDSTREFAFYMLYQEIALDKTFWQSLGKALGWCQEQAHFDRAQCKPWDWYAHRFYDLILTGGDTEKYWNKLLK